MSIKQLFAAALLTVSAASHASVIVGGSVLLDDSGLSRITSWLGHGDLTLTNIFTKASGNTSTDFHAAVDGKGATFVLMRASGDNGQSWKTVGGYDPVSWSSEGDAHRSPNPADWTAFIFNLTDSVMKKQSNSYQTYNSIDYGPAFGGGPDLLVDSDLMTGYSVGWSYGDGFNETTGITGTDGYKSIVDGSLFDFSGPNMLIGALEVFAVADDIPPGGSVPEPGTLALLGIGMLGWRGSRRKAWLR